MNDADKKTAFMSIRLPKDLRKQVKQQANKNHRTLAGQVLFYVLQGIEKDSRADANDSPHDEGPVICVVGGNHGGGHASRSY